jgi:outer membrane protein assembly factor BamD
MTRARLGRGAALLLLIAGVGCAHGTEPDVSTLASSSDQIIWEAAQKALEKRAWQTARQYMKRIVDGFPQSEHVPGARLALGDTHFEEGGTANYILAIEEYRQFLTFYPSHARSDYAQFRVAEAYFKQRNASDRDQHPTEEALEEYRRLLETYPVSTYAEQARQRIAICRASLAQAEHYVGYFYQRTRKAYRAAITRYQNVLRDYPDYPKLDEVLYRLGQCLDLTNRCAEALPLLAQLLEEYPQSRFSQDGQNLYQEVSSKCASPAPQASPSPSPSPSTTPP